MIITDVSISDKGLPKSLGSTREKMEYLSTGRVTVGRISLVFERDFKYRYVARIKGHNFGDIFDDPLSAYNFGKEQQKYFKSQCHPKLHTTATIQNTRTNEGTVV